MIETERLLLRPWRDEDVDPLARMNADPRVVRYLTTGGRTLSRAETEAQLERFQAHWRDHGFGIWAVEERATGRLVGRIGLSYHRLWPEEPELGWKLDAGVWGRGYATEGGAAGLAYAFDTLGVPRVVSIIHPENEPSLRVARRLGFALDGTLLWPEAGEDLLRFAAERGHGHRA